MQLNLRPIISPQSASAVSVEAASALIWMWVQSPNCVRVTNGGAGERTTPTSPQKKQNINKQTQRISDLNMKNTADPLTSASTLGCLLASDAPIRALKYANFPLCCRIWVNFPPLVRVTEACRIRHTALNYCTVQHHTHHR